MLIEAKNKDKVNIVLNGGLEIPAFRKAIAKNLGIVSRIGYGIRSAVTEIRDGVGIAFDSESKGHPLSVSVSVDRLPAVHTSLEHRAAELGHLSTIYSSGDPGFFKAYGSPEYLDATQMASQELQRFIAEGQKPPES